MSRPYWRPSNYLCPDCARRLESTTGPGGINCQECPNCEWAASYDPDADEYPSDELERARLATDGGRAEYDRGDEHSRITRVYEHWMPELRFVGILGVMAAASAVFTEKPPLAIAMASLSGMAAYIALTLRRGEVSV